MATAELRFATRRDIELANASQEGVSMIRSMTAYAQAESEIAGAALRWEIRSVNHRYLEPAFRLPDSLRRLEPALRDILKNHVQRGKLECSLRLQTTDSTGAGIQINQQRALEIIEAAQEILALGGNDCASIDPLEVLRWPGVQQEQQQDEDELGHAALNLFADALDLLVSEREREGKALAMLICERAAQVRDCCELVRDSVPEIVEAMQGRIRQRLQEAEAEVDAQRIEGELVLLANRMDVEEELDRLLTHLDEIAQILRAGNGAVGRRLDFLMQELNREANTICAKSAAADVTSQGVEMKVLIEQMREQVQNLE